MARSEAWKARRRQEREGGRNPEEQRGSWNGIRPVERRTPTRREAQLRQEQKHKPKWNPTPYGCDGSILHFREPASGVRQAV